jgi:7-cyano-7-deazaguanine synthase|tara:strand:+ start:3041 stop:3724 length:684 start_codon:yes stop_codon:yes gene_type:complete
MTKALVLLSGGQDSTTCLYWALRKTDGFTKVESISFDYGQKHKIEIQKAEIIARKAGVEWTLLKAPEMYGTSPLVNQENIVGTYKSVEDLPEGIEPTFVPARNILFLTMAANFALSKDIYNIVTGVCQVDYGGYPDCRAGFISSMQKTLNIGIFGESSRIIIHTPLMYLTKKETVTLADELYCIKALADTHTCYDGQSPPCGKCHSCLLRARGFEEAGIEDPLMKGE